MKKISVLLCCIAFLFAFPIRASARIFASNGLEIRRGASEIRIASGRRITISVRHAFWKTPKLHGLHYAVEDPAVAWVDRLGRLHAERPGKTVLYVRDGKNNIGSIRVTVTGEKKIPAGFLHWFLLFFVSFLIIFLPLKFRCFE